VTLAALVQPLSANDIVAIGAMFFGGVVLVIRSLRPSQSPADAKVDSLTDTVKGVMDLTTTLTAAVQQLSLHTQPPQANGTTTTTTTTTKPVNPPLVDTVAGMPVVPPKPAAPLRVQT
jgi:hypothetical protein